MHTFVTGGTGFIGNILVRRLAARGDEVRALVRSKKGKEKMEAAGAQAVWGDVTERASLREGMAGCDLVFHVAAWYKLGSRDWLKAETINVEGTRNVLELAYELGVPKIVYTSTLAVYGDTHGIMADESYVMPSTGGVREFRTEYDRTKWMAHYQVALPLIERGAPIIIVLPGVVFGPGDHSLIAQLMEAWYRGLFPVFPGPETSYTYAHVDDIVEAHLLAAENGRLGESYVIAGPAMSFQEIVPLWARLAGKPVPLAYLPSRFLHPLAPVAQALGERIPGWPELLSADAVRVMGCTYIARADKALGELGWKPRPVEEGMRQTLDWVAAKSRAEPLLSPRQKQIAGLSLAALAVLLLAKKKRARR
jgi:nucleoside-diphosphate-sugar epimerase